MTYPLFRLSNNDCNYSHHQLDQVHLWLLNLLHLLVILTIDSYAYVIANFSSGLSRVIISVKTSFTREGDSYKITSCLLV